MAIKKEHKDILIALINKHVPECKIYLFGSQATGKASESSDIDIALDAGKSIPFNIILSILAEIDETVIPIKIDMVDMYVVQEKLKQAILKEGILWKN